MQASISENGEKITLEVNYDELCLISCALRADHYMYGPESMALKYRLETDIRNLTTQSAAAGRDL